MNSEATLLTEKIGLSLGECARQARHRLTLAAPFIKRKALERLIADIAPSVTLTVFTRWRVDEISAGASDLSVFDLLYERVGSRLLLHARLHAKVLLIDDQLAAIGSANVTDAALGFADQPNAELMAVLQPVPNRLFLFLLHLERDAVPATAELRRKFEEAVKAAAPPRTPAVVDVTGDAPRGPPSLFPCFRNPEQLYRGYVSVVEFSDHETRAAILDDLEALALPDGLDEPAFRQRVGAGLLSLEMVRNFDEYVGHPRYFGEMAEWLKGRGVLADQSQENRKRYLQTLVRWLRHFLPGRYRLEEPNYSELFGRVEGWSDWKPT
jgi:hypothetical protein